MPRPISPVPDSPSSLHDATATIDKLTNALSNYTRAPSPEPPNVTTCCCGREDCESTRAWTAYKAKLESRLMLSAEIGQALLERHEAYVRRHEVCKLANAILEKRLSQALVNHEVAEVTYQNTLEQLKRAQDRVTQLSTQNARLVGVQSRLEATLQEKDDMQQERDSAVQRARGAEVRLASLKEKCSKLQSQMAHLREDADLQRSQRRKMSEDILSDARSRLQQMQRPVAGSPVVEDNGGVTKVLESLVADNERLKHDNAELQDLLSSTREDLRALQIEVDERRASDSHFSDDLQETVRPNSYGFTTSPLSPTFNFGTAPAPSVLDDVFQSSEARPSSSKRAHSAERTFRRNAEPLTPETDKRPLSPSSIPSHSRYYRGRTGPQIISSTRRNDTDDDRLDRDVFAKPSLAQQSLLSLTRSRAVQTDGTGWHNLVTSPLPHTFADLSHDGHSETSSLDANPSVVGVIVERTAQLLSRLVQADALTLTNRLKRQRLLGADISHLSRTTVSSILNESNNLRAQFRAFLEDEKVITTCTRRDLRALFKLFKDMFAEMGQLRVTLNDVILDPTVAGRVSEMALHPSKSGTGMGEGGATSSTPGWMAPISKLLGLPGGSVDSRAVHRLGLFPSAKQRYLPVP
ncbi:hypothetical protein NM688_g4510 [Phlebia brevispora]|uniref:Uncharacterized protein n=1 Tax=Phlebia brevispora TaxID=194682 RepID=A0ACC1T2Q8_9APHY|nr:hypothetical protein NM688_g4510 [Phlebia brevispora]